LAYIEEPEAETIRDALHRQDSLETEAILAMGAGDDQSAIASELLERYPERPSVMAYALFTSGTRPIGDAEFYRQARDGFAERWPHLALYAAMRGAAAHEELNEGSDLAKARELLDKIEDPNPALMLQLCQMVLQSATGANPLPEALGDRFRERLVEWYPKVRDSQPYGQYLFTMTAAVLK